jgi:hypothetical protein
VSDAVRSVALRAVERFLLAHIVLRIPAKFTVGALLRPLFGQFQKVGSRKVAVAEGRGTRIIGLTDIVGSVS